MSYLPASFVHPERSHPHAVSGFVSSLSQGVGLFCDVTHSSHSFCPGWTVPPSQYAEGQECFYLRVPVGTAFVISNQPMTHSARVKEMYNKDKVYHPAKQALEQDKRNKQCTESAE